MQFFTLGKVWEEDVQYAELYLYGMIDMIDMTNQHSAVVGWYDKQHRPAALEENFTPSNNHEVYYAS